MGNIATAMDYEIYVPFPVPLFTRMQLTEVTNSKKNVCPLAKGQAVQI